MLHLIALPILITAAFCLASDGDERCGRILSILKAHPAVINGNSSSSGPSSCNIHWGDLNSGQFIMSESHGQLSLVWSLHNGNDGALSAAKVGPCHFEASQDGKNNTIKAFSIGIIDPKAPEKVMKFATKFAGIAFYVGAMVHRVSGWNLNVSHDMSSIVVRHDSYKSLAIVSKISNGYWNFSIERALTKSSEHKETVTHEIASYNGSQVTAKLTESFTLAFGLNAMIKNSIKLAFGKDNYISYSESGNKGGYQLFKNGTLSFCRPTNQPGVDPTDFRYTHNTHGEYKVSKMGETFEITEKSSRVPFFLNFSTAEVSLKTSNVAGSISAEKVTISWKFGSGTYHLEVRAKTNSTITTTTPATIVTRFSTAIIAIGVNKHCGKSSNKCSAKNEIEPGLKNEKVNGAAHSDIPEKMTHILAGSAVCGGIFGVFILIGILRAQYIRRVV